MPDGHRQNRSQAKPEEQKAQQKSPPGLKPLRFLLLGLLSPTIVIHSLLRYIDPTYPPPNHSPITKEPLASFPDSSRTHTNPTKRIAEPLFVLALMAWFISFMALCFEGLCEISEELATTTIWHILVVVLSGFSWVLLMDFENASSITYFRIFFYPSTIILLTVVVMENTGFRILWPEIRMLEKSKDS